MAFDVAREVVLSHAHSFGTESRPLAQAIDKVLAEDLTAIVSMPRFDNSSVDGFAVGKSDLDELSNTGQVLLKMGGTIAAGVAPPDTIAPGNTVKVMTGAPVPRNGSAVIMQEDSAESADGILLSGPATEGQFIRREGEEFQSGDVLLGTGTRLNPVSLSLAASAGHSSLSVALMPRVGILTSGSELVAPGNPLEAAQIYDSLSFGLAAALRKFGVEELVAKHCTDDLDETTQALSELLETCDVVITAGGASVGEFDYLGRASKALNVEGLVVRVAMKPGRPFHFGMKGKVPVFGLPGNPLSAWATFALFVMPYLRRSLNSRADIGPAVVLCDEPLESTGDRDEFILARIKNGRAILQPKRLSHMLLGLVSSTHLLHLPAHSPTSDAGAWVPAYPLPWTH